MSKVHEFIEGGAVIRPAGWSSRSDWDFSPGAEGFQFEAPPEAGGGAPAPPPIAYEPGIPEPPEPPKPPERTEEPSYVPSYVPAPHRLPSVDVLELGNGVGTVGGTNFVLGPRDLAIVRNICAQQIANDLMDWVYEPLPDIEGGEQEVQEPDTPPLPAVPELPKTEYRAEEAAP